jgi:uncharacterized protein involved in high-affinity Fe2+ transport
MKMKTRFFLPLSLLLLLLAACAPQTAAPEAPAATQAGVNPPAAATATAQPAAVEPSATQPVAVEVLPVATSRGPDLHATDPSTVNLASGQLQFVEFFRFT